MSVMSTPQNPPGWLTCTQPAFMPHRPTPVRITAGHMPLEATTDENGAAFIRHLSGHLSVRGADPYLEGSLHFDELDQWPSVFTSVAALETGREGNSRQVAKVLSPDANLLDLIRGLSGLATPGSPTNYLQRRGSTGPSRTI